MRTALAASNLLAPAPLPLIPPLTTPLVNPLTTTLALAKVLRLPVVSPELLEQQPAQAAWQGPLQHWQHRGLSLGLALHRD